MQDKYPAILIIGAFAIFAASMAYGSPAKWFNKSADQSIEVQSVASEIASTTTNSTPIENAQKINESVKKEVSTQKRASQEEVAACGQKTTDNLMSICYSTLAIKYQDFGVCENFNSDDRKDACLVAAMVKNPDIKLCSKMLKGQSYIDNCYNNVAVHDKDIKICDYITSTTRRNSCLSFFASANSNLSACDSMQDRGSRNLCYINYALAEGKIEACKKLSDESLINGCYKAVGITQKDLSICDRISDSDEVRNCYIGVKSLQ